MTYLGQIKEYIKKNIKKGYTLESLRWALVNQGYSRTSIEQAISQVHKELALNAPVLKEKPKITYQIIGENDKPIIVKKSWFEKLFGL